MTAMLKDKVALITGGTRGIGKEIAKTYLKEGAVVYYTSIVPSADDEELAALAKENSARAHCVKLDVTAEQECASVVKEIAAKEGRIDILVNNAGITKDGLIFRMPSDDWHAVISANLTGSFFMCRETANIMIKQRAGSIINISSVVGETGNAGQTNYSSSKAGLLGLTKSLARETAARGVRVNAIAPGFIDTAMTQALKPEQREALTKQIPLGRMGSAQDIANGALFLASDFSSYITGHTLDVNGGMRMG